MKLTRRDTLGAFGTAAAIAALPVGVAPASAQGLSDLMEPGPLGEHMKGDANAPVTIIKYASMTCPHCRSWHINHFPEIEEKYIETGKAKFYMREFPFDHAAAAAFMLAECAGQDLPPVAASLAAQDRRCAPWPLPPYPRPSIACTFHGR